MGLEARLFITFRVFIPSSQSRHLQIQTFGCNFRMIHDRMETPDITTLKKDFIP